MTTLNTIIEEEKKAFVYKLNRLTPAGGFMLENGNYGHGMLSETFMTAFLTTAMQRAYEAGRQSVLDDEELEPLPEGHPFNAILSQETVASKIINGTYKAK